MNSWFVVMVLLVDVTMPVVASANQGILLLAHNGTPEWNAQVKDLAVRVNAQKPIEVAFGTPTRSTVAMAVDRLAMRGASEVVAVPFFLSAAVSPDALMGHAIPVKTALAEAPDSPLSQIVVSRAQEISQAGTAEVLVVFGYSSEDAGTPWAIDLAPLGRRLNQIRQFGSILTVAKPRGLTDAEQQQVRRALDRQVASSRRILVVPLIMRSTGTDPAIERTLEGFQFRIAKGAVISDDRMAEWIVSQSGTLAR